MTQQTLIMSAALVFGFSTFWVMPAIMLLVSPNYQGTEE